MTYDKPSPQCAMGAARAALALAALCALSSPAAAQQCDLPWIDVWDSTDADPNNWVLIGQVHAIQTAQTGQQHYNYYSVSAHPSGVNISYYNSNLWMHENTNTGDYTFAFVFGEDQDLWSPPNSLNDANNASLRFRIADSTTNAYVSQSDDPGEAVESPAGSDAFTGNYWYNYNTDGIAVSGIGGADWTVIIDAVDFGDITAWYAASGELADFSDDLTLTMGNEYRLTPACHTPTGKSVVVSQNDTDEDGFIDDEDNCPLVANPGQENADNDVTGDACDVCPNDATNDAADHDGVCQNEDNCPAVANASQSDVDGDGFGDVCDLCAGDDLVGDSDEDGVCDDQDVCNGGDDRVDGDGDGTPDDCDSCPADATNDSDGDALCDSADPCPLDFDNDADGDGLCSDADPCPYDADNDLDLDGICGDVDVCPEDPANDADGDGVCGNVDACPGFDDTADADADGTADGCDVCPNDAANDADSDGICGDVDACPLDAYNDADGDGLCGDVDACPNDAANDVDGDGVCGDVDPCPVDFRNDADGDGLCEADDNCDDTSNPTQSDIDEDGIGDACDPDNDNDGVPDIDDNCVYTMNPGQEDADGDGMGDVCDLDADGDDVLDAIDACPGTDVGAVVEAEGCSIAQLCPCENSWKNHGAYVSCTAHAAEGFLETGLITEAEKDAIVSEAGESSCGHKK